jgi:hypothetical protein
MKNVDFSRLPAWSRNVELGDQQNGMSDRPQIKDSKIIFDALSDEVFNIDMKKKSATCLVGGLMACLLSLYVFSRQRYEFFDFHLFLLGEKRNLSLCFSESVLERKKLVFHRQFNLLYNRERLKQFFDKKHFSCAKPVF